MRWRTLMTLIPAAALLGVACSDEPKPFPAEPSFQASSATSLSCDPTRIDLLIDYLYPVGHAQTGAERKFSSIETKISQGKTADARQKMFDLLKATLADLDADKLLNTSPTLGITTPEAVSELFQRLYTCVELPPPGDLTVALDPSGAGGAAVISPGDPTTTVETGDQQAGVSVPSGAISTSQSVLVTITPDPLGTNPFPGGTLDQFPPFYDFSTFPDVPQFASPVLVGICVDLTAVPTEVARRLQLAHPDRATGGTTLELLARVDATFLPCASFLSAGSPDSRRGWSGGSGLLDRLATSVLSLFRPRVLRAATFFSPGGLGGQTTSFSDFRAVDPGRLAFTVQPSDAAANQTIVPPVTVTLQDQSGATITDLTGTVSVAIDQGTGTPGAVVSGTTTRPLVSGVATFDDLSIDAPGTGYTISAHANIDQGAVPDTGISAPFDISAAHLIFTQQPSTTVAGASISPSVEVTALDASNNVLTGFAGVVTVAITSGTGTSGAVLWGTLSEIPSSGVATFANLAIDTAGLGYTLTATSPGLTAATSSAFDISAGPVSQFVFTSQPVTAVAGQVIAPAVAVEAQDAFGNVASGYAGNVTMFITPGSGASGATLSGTTTVTPVDGVATFVDLSVDLPGMAYTLTATDGVVTSGASAPFDITAPVPGWAAMSSGTSMTLFDVWGASATDVFAVGDNGTIIHYDGSSWSPQVSGTSAALYAVWGTSGSDVFAVGGSSGTILHYDGTTWSPQTSPLTDSLSGVWGTSGTNVFAVGYNGAIIHYDGTSWSVQASGGPWLMDVWGTSGSDVFAVGMVGTVLHYDGSAWTSLPTGTSDPFYGVWGAGSSDVFGVGTGFTIYHYDGTNWNPQSTGIPEPQLAVWGTTGSNVFAAGNGGTILRYDGTSWTQESSGTFYALWGIWGSSATDVFAVGYAGTVLRRMP